MAIFLRQSYNIPPVRWGSDAEIQYAVMKNCEKIYGIDSAHLVLSMPLFWGMPCCDYSMYENNGINNDAQPSIEGFDFNGSSSAIQIANSASLNPSYISVLAKIKTSASGAYAQICTKDKATVPEQRVWQFRKSNADVINFIPFNAASNGSETGTTNIADGISHHVAATWDGAKIQVYVDGKVDGSGSNFAGTLRTGQTNDVFIGKMESAIDPAYFNGFIDIPLIFSVALLPNQIALFNDLPYGLYQSVSKPIYFIPSTLPARIRASQVVAQVEWQQPGKIKSFQNIAQVEFKELVGWTGKICGVTNPTKINGIAVTDITSVIGIS